MNRNRKRRNRNGGPTLVGNNRRQPHLPDQLTASDFPPLQSNGQRSISTSRTNGNDSFARRNHHAVNGLQEPEGAVPERPDYSQFFEPPERHPQQPKTVPSTSPAVTTGRIPGLKPFPPKGTNTIALYNQTRPQIVIPRQEGERSDSNQLASIRYELDGPRRELEREWLRISQTRTTHTNRTGNRSLPRQRVPGIYIPRQPIDVVQRLRSNLGQPPSAIFEPRSFIHNPNPFKGTYSLGTGIFAVADVGRNQSYFKVPPKERRYTDADINIRKGLPWYGDFPPPPGPNAMCRKIKKAKQPDPSRWEEEQIPDLGEHIRPDIDVITVEHDYPTRKLGARKRKAVYDRYRPGHFELWSFSFIFNVSAQRGHYSLRRTDVSDNSPPERPEGYVENELPHFMYHHALAACITNDDEENNWFWRIVDVGQGKKRMSFWVVVERERRRLDHWEDELKTKVLKDAMLDLKLFSKGQGAGNADRLGRSNGITYLGRDFVYERA